MIADDVVEKRGENSSFPSFSTKNISLRDSGGNIGGVAVLSSALSAARRKLRVALEEFRASPPSLCNLTLNFSLTDVIDAIGRLSPDIRHLAVLGTGGSTLCPQALTGALGKSGNPGKRVCFIDNVDYEEIAPLLHTLPPERTAFVAISKSGNTLETLAQTMHCMEWFQRAASPRLTIADRFLMISDPPKAGATNRLRALGAHYGVPVIDHEAIGGRFSIFTAVGLLPAAFLGIDVHGVAAGAREAASEAFEDGSVASEAALCHYLAERAGFAVDILMSYSHKFKGFTAWLAQLRAESLGKKGYGLTPVTSVGTLDQHSQLQLFLDGKPDKLFTVLYEKNANDPAMRCDLPQNVDMRGLRGASLSQVLIASARATIESLSATGAPVRAFSPDAVDARFVGKLAMQSMIETIVAARLFGVDPYTQPAVEAGKRRATEMLESGENR